MILLIIGLAGIRAALLSSCALPVALKEVEAILGNVVEAHNHIRSQNNDNTTTQ